MNRLKQGIAAVCVGASVAFTVVFSPVLFVAGFFLLAVEGY